VGSAEDGGSGRLVAAAGLDTNEPVLDDVDTADTVLAAKGVEGEENLDAVSVLLVIVGDDDPGGETTLEFDGDALGSLGSILGSGGQLPHICRRGGVGVLEDAGLVGDVEQVLISRPGLGGGLDDGDVLLGGILEKGLATREPVVELWVQFRKDNEIM